MVGVAETGRRGPRHICIVRPEIWSDARFKELSWNAKLLWLGLPGFLDCAGRGEFDVARFAAMVFNDALDGEDVRGLFEELEIVELIEVYGVDGVDYVQICDFGRHQRVDRRRGSRLPDREGVIAPRPARKAGISVSHAAIVERGIGSNPGLGTPAFCVPGRAGSYEPPAPIAVGSRYAPSSRSSP